MADSPFRTASTKRPFDSAPDRPAKRTKYDYNKLIKVVVGSPGQTFTIHEDVICEKSDFFRNACAERRWRYGEEKVVRLPEQKPSDFQSYVDWIWPGEVTVENSTNLSELIDIYLLGNHLGDVNLHNKCTRVLTARATASKMAPTPQQVTRLWENTTPDCPLRKWTIHAVIMRLSSCVLRSSISKYPVDFNQQLAVQLHQHTPATTVRKFEDKLAEHLEYDDSDEDDP